MKNCIKCQELKPLFDFAKRPTALDGYRNICKICHKKQKDNCPSGDKTYKYLKQKAYREKQGEQRLIEKRQYHHANKELINKKKKEYRLSNLEKVKQQSKDFYYKNREKLLQDNKAWHALHKDEKRAYDKIYNAANKERKKSVSAAWKRQNKAKVSAYNRQRKLLKMKAMPPWANKSEIESFYKTADALAMHTGDFYHVDHIVPLKSKLVCGLHCPANLRVVTQLENLQKGNWWWPDMPI